MRILHILDHSLPLHSGYTFRTLSILREQGRLGWETSHLTGPKQHSAERLEETADQALVRRTPDRLDERPDTDHESQGLLAISAEVPGEQEPLRMTREDHGKTHGAHLVDPCEDELVTRHRLAVPGRHDGHLEQPERRSSAVPWKMCWIACIRPRGTTEPTW